MYIDKDSKIPPLLADMHYDGVRFDPNILQALQSQRAMEQQSEVQNG